MKITIENTDQIVKVSRDVNARIWEGTTDSGVRVHCLITRIAVHNSEDQSQFERELEDVTPASARTLEAFPTRLT